MLLPLAILGFINGTTFLVLGLLVLAANPKRKLNRIYGVFSFFVVIWSISYGFWLLAMSNKNQEAALFWARMLDLGALFIPVTMYHWILVLLEIEKEKINKIIRPVAK